MEAMNENLSIILDSCMERVEDGLKRTLTRMMKWTKEGAVSKLGLDELVFLMVVSSLANHDIEICGMLLREIDNKSLLELQVMLELSDKKWQVPRKILDKAMKFAHFLEVSDLFFIPSLLPAYLAELLTEEAPTSIAKAAAEPTPEPSKIQASSNLHIDKYTGAIQKVRLPLKNKTPKTALNTPSEPFPKFRKPLKNKTPKTALNTPSEPFPKIRKMSRLGAQRQLWEGVEKDDGQLVEGAVLSGADLNLVRADKGYMTPLALAASEGHLRAVRALVRLGAPVEGRAGKKNRTVLHWASAGGHVAIVRKLLKKGAHIEALDSSKYTPLHLASQNGREAAVLELLEAGANVAAVDSTGWTPLHWASYNGHLATVRLLVEDGAADFNTRASRGRTPLYWADYNKQTAVAEYLRSVGATK